MKKVLNMTYESELTRLTELNSSFDSGVLRICYTGDNRNQSSFSKESIEKSLKTIYNCPIVCNYDRETNTLGGHDMEAVRDADGSIKIVNITQPVGVIPESAKVWFEEFEEKDGSKKEYLYSEALIWKRQEAYKKIKNDGITAHSMEINVKEGFVRDDGFFEIQDFEFTAFALIGVEPCFESSSLTMFSKREFKEELMEMMNDLKMSAGSYNLDSCANTADDNTNNNPVKGGTIPLETELQNAEFTNDSTGDTVTNADNVEDVTTQVDGGDVNNDTAVVEFDEQTDGSGDGSNGEECGVNDEFALNRQLIDSLCEALSAETIITKWSNGNCVPRYRLEDFDDDAQEVYAWDISDWLLYGFAYTKDNDSIIVDFESKTRKKFAIVDYVDGDEQKSPFIDTAMSLSKAVSDSADRCAAAEKSFDDAANELSELKSEIASLREFRENAERESRSNAVNEVFTKFEDLCGIESFDALKANCDDMSIDAIEDKCFAIRGRSISSAKQTYDKSPKIKVCVTEKSGSDCKYGSLFDLYLGDK